MLLMLFMVLLPLGERPLTINYHVIEPVAILFSALLAERMRGHYALGRKLVFLVKVKIQLTFKTEVRWLKSMDIIHFQKYVLLLTTSFTNYTTQTTRNSIG